MVLFLSWQLHIAHYYIERGWRLTKKRGASSAFDQITNLQMANDAQALGRIYSAWA
jgi:hypothetical protein